jgi:hypothetical protein
MSNLKETFKMLDLRGICEHMDKDYDTLVMICEKDCREVWEPDSIIPFDEYLRIHLGRVLTQIRSNPSDLDLYTL